MRSRLALSLWIERRLLSRKTLLNHHPWPPLNPEVHVANRLAGLHKNRESFRNNPITVGHTARIDSELVLARTKGPQYDVAVQIRIGVVVCVGDDANIR